MHLPPVFGNLFTALPPPAEEEAFEILLNTPHCRIERIVSHGHASPPGFWYEQANDEWVMLAQGSARLAFDDGRVADLIPGDWVCIPARLRHRVEATGPATVWLAVHCHAAS